MRWSDTVVGFGAAQYHGGDPSGGRQHPDDHVDDLGLDRRADVQGLDRVAHGHVTVHTHHSQGEDTGEHVVIIDGDEHFAGHLAKRPGAEQVVGALEGHGGGDQGVGQRQVENVNVGGGFHLGVPLEEDKKTHMNNTRLAINGRLGRAAAEAGMAAGH